MSKIFTRRELPISLALPFALQMAQQLKGADKASELTMTEEQRKSLMIMLPGDLTFPAKATGNSQITLFGNPQEEMSLYGLHMRWEPHSNSRPHTHKYERYIWVLKGTWWVGAGAEYNNMEGTVPVPAGSFVLHKAKEMHYDGAKDEACELLIVGHGPTANLGPNGEPAAGGRGRGRGQTPPE